MTEFRNPLEARAALLDYLYDREEAIPDDVREGLLDTIKLASPVKCVVEAIKLVVDRQPDCPPDLQQWAAGAAIMSHSYGFGQITADVVEILKGGQ